MTLFRERKPKLPKQSRKERIKVWTKRGREKWRASLDWWEKVEIDAREPSLPRWKRLRARIVITLCSYSAAFLAVAGVVALALLIAFLAATVGLAVVLFLNTRHLVNVTWHNHWKG